MENSSVEKSYSPRVRSGLPAPRVAPDTTMRGSFGTTSAKASTDQSPRSLFTDIAAIDPTRQDHITRFDRTDEELIQFWHFALFVRGKHAEVQAKKLHQFHQMLPPRNWLQRDFTIGHDSILNALHACKAGQYNTLLHAMIDTNYVLHALGINFFRNTSAEGLERFRGVGPKTARFFILHSRPNAPVVALDTHILRWLAAKGERVPRNTPPAGQDYRRLEGIFLQYAKNSGMSPADFDYAIWLEMRNR